MSGNAQLQTTLIAYLGASWRGARCLWRAANLAGELAVDTAFQLHAAVTSDGTPIGNDWHMVNAEDQDSTSENDDEASAKSDDNRESEDDWGSVDNWGTDDNDGLFDDTRTPLSGDFVVPDADVSDDQSNDEGDYVSAWSDSDEDADPESFHGAEDPSGKPLLPPPPSPSPPVSPLEWVPPHPALRGLTRAGWDTLPPRLRAQLAEVMRKHRGLPS